MRQRIIQTGEWIGFCLIRQSSASPIVCSYQSTRFLRLHRTAEGALVNERRERGIFPPLFLLCERTGIVDDIVAASFAIP
jgi:hypothetical protein